MSLRSDALTSERGMSLIEMLISILLLSMMMVAFLGLLDLTSKMARVQGEIADSTENVRFSINSLARIVRMAGTGGLPVVTLGQANAPGSVPAYQLKPLALEVDDNVLSGALYGGKEVIGGTDVLKIRGAVRCGLWDIDGLTDIDFSTGLLTIKKTSPYPGRPPQELDPGSSDNTRMPIFLALNHAMSESPTATIDTKTFTREYNDYRIVEAEDMETPVTYDDEDDPTEMYIRFTTTILDENSAIKNNPGEVWVEPLDSGTIYAAGFLETMDFFVAENDSGEPSLYRFMGNGFADEMVPNIRDLQIALGCDLNGDEEISDTEWFLSKDQSIQPSAEQMLLLREVRITVVARGKSPNAAWNDEMTAPENAPQLSGDDQKYHHRAITVRVGLRCHPDAEETT